MHERYKDQFAFLAVYVREAHPVDGWRLPDNDQAGIRVRQPRNAAERAQVAKQCSAALSMSMPMVMDEMDDRVGHLYSGMPDRLYVIDADGKVVYKSGRGPGGFKPLEMEQSILLHLLDQTARK
jgi:hypothetical protein